MAWMIVKIDSTRETASSQTKQISLPMVGIDVNVANLYCNNSPCSHSDLHCFLALPLPSSLLKLSNLSSEIAYAIVKFLINFSRYTRREIFKCPLKHIWQIIFLQLSLEWHDFLRSGRDYFLEMRLSRAAQRSDSFISKLEAYLLILCISTSFTLI